jgi:hypothetical protein
MRLRLIRQFGSECHFPESERKGRIVPACSRRQFIGELGDPQLAQGRCKVDDAVCVCMSDLDTFGNGERVFHRHGPGSFQIAAGDHRTQQQAQRANPEERVGRSIERNFAGSLRIVELAAMEIELAEKIVNARVTWPFAQRGTQRLFRRYKLLHCLSA